MLGFLLWVLLLVLCSAARAPGPAPLPHRLGCSSCRSGCVGIAVDGVLGLVKAILFLPARLLGGPNAVRQ